MSAASPNNVLAVLRMAADRLRAEPLLAENAPRDAHLLLAHALGVDTAALRAWPERVLTSEESAHFDRLIAERLRFVPIQHLRGVQEFFGRDFVVSPAVLIPRPETELLVEESLRRAPRDRPVRIADVGTGSGAIAITLALELPLAEVVALDLSAAALEVARRNAKRHVAADRVRFVASDLLSAVAAERFDVIVSNPPYIPEHDRASLHPEVREHEPAMALFGGEDGFAILLRLIAEATTALTPGGWLLLETAGNNGPVLEALRGWAGQSTARDLQGIERVVMAQR